MLAKTSAIASRISSSLSSSFCILDPVSIDTACGNVDQTVRTLVVITPQGGGGRILSLPPTSHTVKLKVLVLHSLHVDPDRGVVVTTSPRFSL